jgi:fibronectin type 3 domain-containing protein
VAAETSYKVERSLDGSTGWTQIATTSADATTYRSSGLAAATEYFYRVRASNAGGDSGYSNVASARTNADTTAPTVPTNVKASAGKGKATITWSASTDTGSGLAGYRVYRATASTGPFSHVWTTPNLSFTDMPLVKGTTYWYYVVAYDNAGNTSAASAKVSVRPT